MKSLQVRMSLSHYGPKCPKGWEKPEGLAITLKDPLSKRVWAPLFHVRSQPPHELASLSALAVKDRALTRAEALKGVQSAYLRPKVLYPCTEDSSLLN